MENYYRKFKLYYTAPPDNIFDEVKQKCIEIWKTYDDTYKYATEKIDRVNRIDNYEDNVMFLIGMFDINNQRKLSDKLSKDARKEIRDRIESTGCYTDIWEDK